MIEEKNITDLFSVKSKEDSKDFLLATDIEPQMEMEDNDVPWNPMDFCETVFSDNEEEEDVFLDTSAIYLKLMELLLVLLVDIM